jgi:toluene monooxygenase electron transfer component
MKVTVNARNRAHRFDAGESEKLLYAGLRCAVDLPYECGSGTCGTCRARLLSGVVHDAWPDAPGRRFLKAADELLLCQCEPRSDLMVEVASFVRGIDTRSFVPAHFRGRIERMRSLTHDIAHLMLALDRPIDFDAGQFVMVRVPGVPGYRGWSMVNYAREADRLEFVVKKKTGGGISEWLFGSAAKGDALELFGPLGRATFYPSLAKDILCIAGGSGIAGMMSIIARAAQERYFAQHRGDLFFGVRTIDDAFFLEELADLAARCGPRFSMTLALSDEAVPESAASIHPGIAFDEGFVHEVAQRRMEGRYQNVRAYVAGPPPAVDASIRMLLAARLSTENIRYDKFS